MTTKKTLSIQNLREGGAIYLFGILLLAFITIPALDNSDPLHWLLPDADRPVRRILQKTVIGAVLVTAAVTVAHTRHNVRLILLLVLFPTCVEISRAIGLTVPAWLTATAEAYTGCALLYIVYRGVRVMFARRAVSANVITVALCAYLLLGLAWMYLYQCAVELNPEGAFAGIADEASAEQRSDALFYFSFVTLTTLGYGDIQPTGGFTRSLAIVEAVIGQLFVAVVLARLVGVQIATAAAEELTRDEPREPPTDDAPDTL